MPTGSTRVTVTLVAEEGGTRIGLRHDDLPSLELRDAHQVARKTYLLRLATRVRAAIPVPTRTAERRVVGSGACRDGRHRLPEPLRRPARQAHAHDGQARIDPPGTQPEPRPAPLSGIAPRSPVFDPSASPRPSQPRPRRRQPEARGGCAQAHALVIETPRRERSIRLGPVPGGGSALN
jgi:hypothetical protein